MRTVKVRKDIIMKNISELQKLDKDTLTINQVAEFFEVHRTTVYNWVNNDPEFPKPSKIGKNTYFSVSSLLSYLNRKFFPSQSS